MQNSKELKSVKKERMKRMQNRKERLKRTQGKEKVQKERK